MNTADGIFFHVHPQNNASPHAQAPNPMAGSANVLADVDVVVVDDDGLDVSNSVRSSPSTVAAFATLSSLLLISEAIPVPVVMDVNVMVDWVMNFRRVLMVIGGVFVVVVIASAAAATSIASVSLGSFIIIGE
jgi:hypothetical protein